MFYSLKKMGEFFVCGMTFIAICTITASDGNQPEAAKELTELLGLKDQISLGFNAMLPLIDEKASELGLDDKGKKELQNILKAWCDKDLDHEALQREIMELYRQAFTEEEIQKLIEFYKTPLGQKTLKVFPEMMQKSVQIGVQEAQAKQEKLMKRLQPFLEKFDNEE